MRFPEQHLEPVEPFPDKDESLTVSGVTPQLTGYDSRQGVDPLAHVHRRRVELIGRHAERDHTSCRARRICTSIGAKLCAEPCTTPRSSGSCQCTISPVPASVLAATAAVTGRKPAPCSPALLRRCIAIHRQSVFAVIPCARANAAALWPDARQASMVAARWATVLCRLGLLGLSAIGRGFVSGWFALEFMPADCGEAAGRANSGHRTLTLYRSRSRIVHWVRPV
jgi:hypothetical protein